MSSAEYTEWIAFYTLENQEITDASRKAKGVTTKRAESKEEGIALLDEALGVF